LNQLICDLVHALVQNKLSGHRHALAHGIDRMAALVGRLRDLDDVVERRWAVNFENITDPLRRVG
jgi:hypothetical protein